MPNRLLSCVATGLAVAAAAGCGSSSSSSSGIASQEPQAILKSSLVAANGLKSVHAAGSIVSNGQRIRIDVHLVNGQGGRGQITVNGLTFQLIRVGRYAYLQAPPAVWQRTGASASAAKLLQGKWLRTPASGQFASVAKLTDIHSLFGRLLTPRGHPKTGSTSTVAGRKVVAIQGRQGTVYVAASGKPYPVELVRTGANEGRLDFDRFNETVALSAPSGAIDVPQAGG